MSETQTREAALSVTVAAIREHGLPLGLDSLSMEDVIRDARVSRTAFYRLWPQREQYVGDLIVELAKDAIPVENIRGEEATAQLKESLLPRMNDLRGKDARSRIVAELLTQTSLPDFAHTASLGEKWRTYFGLTALVMNLPTGEAQAAARKGIELSEARYRARLAHNYRLMMRLFGLRLRESSPATLEDVADIVIALVRGLILRSHGAQPAPGGDILALGASAMFTHFIENDPDVTWDDERIDLLTATLTNERDLFAEGE